MGNIETVNKMYRLFAEGNTEAIKDIFDKDLNWNMMEGFPGGGKYKGLDAVYKNVFGYFKEYWTDWKAVNDRVVDIGDGVILFLGIMKALIKQQEICTRTIRFTIFYQQRKNNCL